MPARKKNLYSQQSEDRLRKEIDSIIEYLEAHDPETIADELDFKVSIKGITFSTIASIEDILKNLVLTIRSASQMLLALHEANGMNEYIKDCTDRLMNAMDRIDEYYNKRPISIIEHRKVSKEFNQPATKKNPNPGKRIQLFLVATKYQQITARTMIKKQIMETLPTLDLLEKHKEEFLVRGGKDLPESMEDNNEWLTS